MNAIPEDKIKKQRRKQKRFLIQVQAFQTLIGYSIGFEDVKMVGANGNVFFSLVGIKMTIFLKIRFSNEVQKESFIDFEPSQQQEKR